MLAAAANLALHPDHSLTGGNYWVQRTCLWPTSSDPAWPAGQKPWAGHCTGQGWLPVRESVEQYIEREPGAGAVRGCSLVAGKVRYWLVWRAGWWRPVQARCYLRCPPVQGENVTAGRGCRQTRLTRPVGFLTQAILSTQYSPSV